MSDSIQTKLAAKPIGNYPHARVVGNLLFLSGIGPRNATDNTIPGNSYNKAGQLESYDIVAQCHSVFANVQAVLKASNANFFDLVDVTVYLTNMKNDFAAYNKVWADYFPDAEHAPCRTTLGITDLPTPIAIELKCIALLKE